MTPRTTAEIRSKYLEFFAQRGHAIIPSASLVPENDPTTLFTSSGMQPMVPYLLGETHPQGRRIADSQKSFRTGDIDDIGDNRHTTFFEMLGNWSLGDYFKKEQIEWMFTFLTEEVGIDPNKLYVTAFIGDEKNVIPKDTEAAEIWKGLFAQKGIEAGIVDIGSEADGYVKGMQGGRIFYYEASKNWWSRAGIPEKMPAGEPGGPDSEMFYDFGIPHDTKFGPHCHPNCDCGRFMEIGNNVFMEYRKNADGTFSKLPQSNVDFGGGLERIAAVALNTPDVFQIDVFKHIIETLEKLSGKKYTDGAYTASFRIVADHIRAAIFLISDGVYPANADQGYFTRRLIRRAVRYWDTLGIAQAGISSLVEPVLSFYKDSYDTAYAQRETIAEEIRKEEEKFRKTLADGMKRFEKIVDQSLHTETKVITGSDAFDLFQSYGFPVEVTVELAQERGVTVDMQAFAEEFKAHQALSRAGSEQKFKGGLGSTGEVETRYHTTTHLLHQALRDVLGPEVGQKGSNITPERLRFDFSFSRKMTDEEKARVEVIVNEKISAGLPVNKIVMKKEDAEKTGALHFFGDKYGDEVNVYFIGDSVDSAYSKEFCGGPHITNTSELGHFKIAKEEAVSAGVRRIKAVLE